MKIVMVSDWFAERMGYSENLFPRALARLGAEVHLVTSNLQPGFPDYQETYERFLGPRQQPTGRRQVDGFTLLRPRPHRLVLPLRPHVVQCFTLASVSTAQVLCSEILLGFKLFLEEHIHSSVFKKPTTWKRRAFFAAYRAILGNLLSLRSERCYPIATDVARIATEYLGYTPSKIQVCSLGVDTDLFAPVSTDEHRAARTALRRSLGFRDEDIVVIYTGRFTAEKNPLCLARAIDLIQREDSRVKGLFVGSGSADYLRSIEACMGCSIHPFVEAARLPEFYRAADIGGWPTQESTSQLDAAACGLPLVLGNKIEVLERVEGNGLLYEEGEPQDLARKIQKLSAPELRRQLGERGVQKVREHYSWDRVARDRLKDYEAALRN